MIGQIKVQAHFLLIFTGIPLYVLEAGSNAQAQFVVWPELITDYQMEYIVYEKIRAEITAGIGLIIIVNETRVVLIVMIYLKFIEGGKGKCPGMKEMESDIGICSGQKVI